MGEQDRQLVLEGLAGCVCDGADLVVFASGSTGNCSALILHFGTRRAFYLIDAGLSPRRTLRLLERHGLGTPHFAGIVLTHLDIDHWGRGWIRPRLPAGAKVHVHRCHKGRAAREGAMYQPTAIFEEEFELLGGVRVRTHLNPHDELGSAAFRFDFMAGDKSGRVHASLGFATDLGCAKPGLIELFRGVDVLAIESNYCPSMQRASGRLQSTKDRIMNGRGHLSNQQSARAVREIAPLRDVVLLHLSQECNRPELAAAAHQHPQRVILSHATTPTPMITVSRAAWEARTITRPHEMAMPRSLWEASGVTLGPAGHAPLSRPA